MRLTREGRFALLLAWSAVAGALLGNGQAHGVTPLVVAGAAMTAVCPAGVIAAWLLARRRRGRG